MWRPAKMSSPKTSQWNSSPVSISCTNVLFYSMRGFFSIKGKVMFHREEICCFIWETRLLVHTLFRWRGLYHASQPLLSFVFLFPFPYFFFPPLQCWHYFHKYEINALCDDNLRVWVLRSARINILPTDICCFLFPPSIFTVPLEPFSLFVKLL